MKNILSHLFSHLHPTLRTSTLEIFSQIMYGIMYAVLYCSHRTAFRFCYFSKSHYQYKLPDIKHKHIARFWAVRDCHNNSRMVCTYITFGVIIRIAFCFYFCFLATCALFPVIIFIVLMSISTIGNFIPKITTSTNINCKCGNPHQSILFL